jgi:hypothetical protein
VQAAKEATYAVGYRARTTEAGTVSRDYEKSRSAELAHKALQADLVRCVFGNPFRPVAFAPGWRTPTVLALAGAIYEEKAFERLPILGDALIDAGCDDAELLGHCRGPGPHARGCWPVDLLLNKE